MKCILSLLHCHLDTVTTFAGSGTGGAANGNGSNASFNNPIGLCLNPNDECMYVCDYNSNTIRKITMQGDVIHVQGLCY